MTGRINAVLVLATCYSQRESPQTSLLGGGKFGDCPGMQQNKVTLSGQNHKDDNCKNGVSMWTVWTLNFRKYTVRGWIWSHCHCDSVSVTPSAASDCSTQDWGFSALSPSWNLNCIAMLTYSEMIKDCLFSTFLCLLCLSLLVPLPLHGFGKRTHFERYEPRKIIGFEGFFQFLW